MNDIENHSCVISPVCADGFSYSARDAWFALVANNRYF